MWKRVCVMNCTSYSRQHEDNFKACGVGMSYCCCRWIYFFTLLTFALCTFFPPPRPSVNEYLNHKAEEDQDCSITRDNGKRPSLVSARWDLWLLYCFWENNFAKMWVETHVCKPWCDRAARADPGWEMRLCWAGLSQRHSVPLREQLFWRLWYLWSKRGLHAGCISKPRLLKNCP